MGKSVKNLVLEAENDRNDEFLHLSPEVVGEINDVEFSTAYNYVKIDFTTTYNKKLSLIVKLDDFKKWQAANRGTTEKRSKNLYKSFVKDYVADAKEVEAEAPINEIIDAEGNIFADGDGAPSNATNRMVGANHVMDLEKIFKRSMPKSVRNYSGNLGLGTVAW